MRLALALLLAVQAFAATVRVGTKAGVRELGLEDYTAAIVAGECKTFRSSEAMRAIAVAARTYTIAMRGRHNKEGFDFCTSTHCQSYQPEAVDNRSREAVQSTAGELLWYRGTPAKTYYSQDCGGRSEAGAVVWPELGETAPYLRVQDDPFCTAPGRQKWTSIFSFDQVRSALLAAGLKPGDLAGYRVGERNASGRVRWIATGATPLSASSFRFAMDRTFGWNQIRSDWFELQVNAGGLRVAGYGTGHGVGLCQHGADAMGISGHTYHEILAHYYPNTTPGLSASGIQWTKLSGEYIDLWTTNPGRASQVIVWMDRAAREAKNVLNAREPDRIRVQVYDTVDVYRDATGEPGWVAASTRGKTIRLAPAGVNENSLRHEFYHVAIEMNAKRGLPLWFREGLVLALCAEPDSGPVRGMQPSEIDAAIAQTQNAALARKGYAAALRRTKELFARYGRSTVVGWVATGIPPAVTAATTTMAAQQSR